MLARGPLYVGRWVSFSYVSHPGLKSTIAKRIVNSFVVSICLGTLAVVQATFAESTLIVSILV